MSAYVDSIATAPTTLTEIEQRRLLKVTGEHAAGWRDHVLFSVALGVGLREHEILALDVGDVLDENDRVRRRVALRVFKGSRADAGPQHVMLPDLVRAKIEKLLSVRRRDGEVLRPSTPLFVSRLGRRLSARQVRHAFGVWQERAGFERHFNFHQLRHAACTNLYRASGGDIRLTQRFARHRSIQTTAIYTHPTDDDMLRALRSLPC